eukprot:COSAG01_NODE_51838_length_351_cov_1.234127_1_plen_63_part_10
MAHARTHTLSLWESRPTSASMHIMVCWVATPRGRAHRLCMHSQQNDRSWVQSDGRLDDAHGSD